MLQAPHLSRANLKLRSNRGQKAKMQSRERRLLRKLIKDLGFQPMLEASL
jgi:hypothetical protein